MAAVMAAADRIGGLTMTMAGSAWGVNAPSSATNSFLSTSVDATVKDDSDDSDATSAVPALLRSLRRTKKTKSSECGRL